MYTHGLVRKKKNKKTKRERERERERERNERILRILNNEFIIMRVK
jgi:hypothetical protein